MDALCRSVAFVVLAVASVTSAAPSGADCERRTANQVEEDQADVLREALLPELRGLPDYAHVRDTFELAIARSPVAVSQLEALTRHSNPMVAGAAAAEMSRFPSPQTSARLKELFNEDQAEEIRVGALAGLQRLNDPEAGAFAARALADSSLVVQRAGARALRNLRDSTHAGEMLAYYERRPQDRRLLEWLGCIGDPVGSTHIRDRALQEANNKLNEFDRRLSAAYALDEMGVGSLVASLLDRQKGIQTHQALEVVADSLRALAAADGIAIQNQGEVSWLLDAASLGRHRQDMWGHDLRARFVRVGAFRVTSDGPDGMADTSDDLSTTEPYRAWAHRVFRDEIP